MNTNITEFRKDRVRRYLKEISFTLKMPIYYSEEAIDAITKAGMYGGKDIEVCLEGENHPVRELGLALVVVKEREQP